MNKLEEKYSNIEDTIYYLTSFGLTNEEAQVYLLLLPEGINGNIVGHLKDSLGIGRTTIYGILERLSEKEWVKEEELSKRPRRVKYIANPPLLMMNIMIGKKEEELIELRDKSLFIGDILDKLYQGPKKVTLDNIHPVGQKYLKPLIEKKWKVVSEVIERSDSMGRVSFDYELKGKGFPKDSGLVLFRYDRDIEEDSYLIQSALSMFKSKTDYEIRRDKIPGFEDLKLEDTTFGDYKGFLTSIKIKLKRKWWTVGKNVVIPLKNQIFLIHGNKENFPLLMDTVLNAEKFHHLI